MKTYVLLGEPGRDGYESTLISKRNLRSTLRHYEDIGRPHVVRYEFKAPSFDVARVIADIRRGWLGDPDEFLKGLAAHYGYDLVPKKAHSQKKS